MLDPQSQPATTEHVSDYHVLPCLAKRDLGTKLQYLPPDGLQVAPLPGRFQTAKVNATRNDLCSPSSPDELSDAAQLHRASDPIPHRAKSTAGTRGWGGGGGQLTRMTAAGWVARTTEDATSTTNGCPSGWPDSAATLICEFTPPESPKHHNGRPAVAGIGPPYILELPKHPGRPKSAVPDLSWRAMPMRPLFV